MTIKKDTQTTKYKRWLRIAWCALSVLAVIFWGRLIFGFSAQDSEESASLSGRVSYAIVDEITQMRQDVLTEKERQNLADRIEYPVRKIAHMTEYAVFALLLFHMLCAFGVKGRARFLGVLLLVFCYAATDEFHQLFVDGRSAQFSDVLIDTAGGLLMLLMIGAVRAVRIRLGMAEAPGGGTRAFE